MGCNKVDSDPHFKGWWSPRGVVGLGRTREPKVLGLNHKQSIMLIFQNGSYRGLTIYMCWGYVCTKFSLIMHKNKQ